MPTNENAAPGWLPGSGVENDCTYHFSPASATPSTPGTLPWHPKPEPTTQPAPRPWELPATPPQAPPSLAHPAPDSSAAEWADYWTGLGLALCAISPGEKGPRTSGWPERPLEPGYWRAHPTEGMGAILGRSGLVSFDGDSIPEAKTALAAVGIELDAIKAGAVIIQGHPDRWRAEYRLPPGAEGLSRRTLTWPDPSGELDAHGRPKRITVFELRAGPVQDCLPPTVHPGTGKPYRLLVAPWELEPWSAPPAALLELWRDWEQWRPILEAACPWAPAKPEPAAKTPPRERAGGESVINAFNAVHDPAAILASHGYKPAGPHRWLSPFSGSGLAGIVRLSETGRIFSHHASDPLAGPPHDPFSLFAVLDHQGDTRAAVRAAAGRLGMERERPPRDDAATQERDTPPGQATGALLTGPEVDKLLAWSARTVATLPDPEATGIFNGPPDPQTGKKPPERLRVSIQEGRDWSAPWRKLLWTHGQAAFMREVESYLPRRAALVERENARRLDQGQPPQDDLAADDLRAHAARWLPGILSLEVTEEEARALLARLPAGSILAPKPGENWRLVPVRELLTEPEPLRWLVRGYIQPDTLNLLFGDPVAGKSLLAIDWAASLATGQPWNGHAPSPAPVVYLAGEGFFGIKRRLFAWALARECLEELRAAPLVVSSAGAALTDGSHVSVVAAAIDEIAAAHGQPGLIVIDTLARNFGAADENSAADVGLFIRAADFLRTRYQAAVLVVHHSGHGDKGRSRGSSAIRGAVDAEFCLSADANGVRTLTATKTKDAPPPPTLGMNLKVIDLPWQTEDGETETSVVLQPDPGAADTPRRRKAPPSVARAFESLLACLDTAGEAPPDTWQPPDTFGPRPALVAPLETWRKEFISRHTGDSDETKGRAFRRAREQLTSVHAVGAWRDAYWPRPDVAPWPDLAALLSAANLCRERNEAGQSPDISIMSGHGQGADIRRTERELSGHVRTHP